METHPRYGKITELLNQKELKGLGSMAISIITGFIARGDVSFSALGDWFVQRLPSGLVGIDTGPTSYNPTTEGLSHLAFLTSIGYLVGGPIFNKLFKGELKRQGLEPLPKKWKDHTVVLDVTRGVFDAVEELKPNNKMVLVHDGRLVKEEEIEGGSLNSKTRRNLNSVGEEHLSDSDFIAWMRPEQAKEIIINLCSVDSILGSFSDTANKSELPISLEKTFNILMTLKNYFKSKSSGKTPRIKILAPEGLNVDQMVKMVGEELNIQVQRPESIFVDAVNKHTDTEEGVSFKTDMTELPVALKSLGMKINDKSKTAFVYQSTDDKTIFEARKLKEKDPNLTVVACIERKSNIEEANAVSDFVWEIPSLVAQKI